MNEEKLENQSLHKKVAIKMLRILILFIITVFILCRVFGSKLVFFPSKYPEGYLWEPQKYGLDVEDCYFNTEDGVKLHGWFIKGNDICLLLCHGNAGNVSDRAENLMQLKKLGYSLFMFDYRGYGKSEGSPYEKGVCLDASAAYNFLSSQKGINPKDIIIWGHSLGGAIAIEFALEHKISGLIVESSFTSIADMVKESIGIRIPGLLPVTFDSISRISKINCPVLIMHGEKDDLIPPEHGKRLFEKAQEPKDFYLIPRADHNNTYIVGGAPYLKVVETFVTKVENLVQKQGR